MSTGILQPSEALAPALRGTNQDVDISGFCTLRGRKRNKDKAGILESPVKSPIANRLSASSDDLYIGTRVSTVPDPEAYAIQVQKPSAPTEIDLNIEETRREMNQLHLSVNKPSISEKAWSRLSNKKQRRSRNSEGTLDDSVIGLRNDPKVDKRNVPQLPILTLGSGERQRVTKSASPAPTDMSLSGSPRRSKKKGPIAIGLATAQKVAIPTITHSIIEEADTVQSVRMTSRAQSESPPNTTDGFLHQPSSDSSDARRSIQSIDSGLGDLDPSNNGRKSMVFEGEGSSYQYLSLSQAATDRQPRALQQRYGQYKRFNIRDGFSSLRAGPKRHHNRKSMLLSELCVVAVSIPADLGKPYRGKGSVLNFRFSPYTRIEFLRVAILKQFHERCDVEIPLLSNLQLCRYLEEEEGWEWLEEDQTLHQYKLPTECKLELKNLEPVYFDVRIVIPSLETSMSVEYDQFSTVRDVLQQVLSLSDPPLESSEGYSLYHVRLRMHLDPTDSMVFYNILPTDVLECRLSVGRLHSVILTVKIPVIQSSRKVKVSLDETVGELISTLMRRIPDPDSNRWTHMALYLQSREVDSPGIWLEDYKFLAAYKLKPTDVLEFRPKYRAMVFELRVFPHDHYGDETRPYAKSELLVAQDTLVSEVVDLLFNQKSLEYDPRYYALFLHDDTQLPSDTAMWEFLDSQSPGGYQDSLIMHMVHKSVKVSLELVEDSCVTIQVDFSQPSRVIRNFLCRRFGVRHYSQYRMLYAGKELDLSLSLHNQGILEHEHVVLVHRGEAASQSSTQSVIHKRVGSMKGKGDNSDAKRASMIRDEEDVNIWNEGPDSNKNIRYDSKRPGLVSGATFNKLVAKMTSEKDHDIEFVKTFLYTYQSFVTPDKLLKKLIERYQVVWPEGMSSQGFAVMKQTIQARVVNAMKLWVELSVDFKDNVALQDALLQFIGTVLILDHPRLCKPLRTNIMVIKGVIQRKNLKMFRDPPPPVKFPASTNGLLTIFDFDPEEVARQMTIIDFSLFAKIKPAELLNQAWQKAKYKHRAGNILRLVERINNLTLWVATTILSQRDVHERAKRISDFVQICSHLLEMHNLCTLMSVLNGLAHPSISRLKKSFSKLDKATSKKLEAFQTLARPGDNFKLLRDELKRSSNPCIPYLGLYMSDLTFLDNGNPNFHADGLINFSKCRLIYNQIRDLVLRQDRPYNFEEVPALHESIIKFHFLDTDVLYDVSLQREPRDKGK